MQTDPNRKAGVPWTVVVAIVIVLMAIVLFGTSAVSFFVQENGDPGHFSNQASPP